MCSLEARVVFSQGSTCFYVSPVFAKLFVKSLIQLEGLFLVATLMGKTLLVELGYRV